jgi:predicted ester cyclase
MKKLLASIPLIVLLCLLCGCQDQAAMAELEAFRAQAELEEKNKDIALRLYEDLDNEDFDAAFAAIDTDAQFFFNGVEPMRFEDLKPLIPTYYSAFTDYTHHVVDVITKGDYVVLKFKYTGIHEAEFMGIPPSGEPIDYVSIQVLKFKDGKVVENWFVEDNLTIYQQLGMELKPKE